MWRQCQSLTVVKGTSLREYRVVAADAAVGDSGSDGGGGDDAGRAHAVRGRSGSVELGPEMP
jgi:hypothetical protein